MNKTLKERLAGTTPVLMVNPNHVSPTLCEKLVRSGADSVFIDCEHGLASWEDIHHMAKAARYGGGFGIVRPGDLSQSMGYSPAVPPGGRRAQEVLDLVDRTLQRIRAAGKVAGTLVVKQDAAHLVAQGAQLLYYHADPFVADGVAAMRQLTSPR